MSEICDECGEYDSYVTRQNENGSTTCLCFDCYDDLEKQERKEIQDHYAHHKMTELLLHEVNRRDIHGLAVTEREGWLDTDLGIELTVKKRKGIGPWRKTLSFDLILEGNEIVGVWTVMNEVTRESRQEVFRLPLKEKNIPIAVNQAMTFIASKT